MTRLPFLDKIPSNPCNLPALSAVGGAADQGGQRDGDREGGAGVQYEHNPSAKQMFLTVSDRLKSQEKKYQILP